EGNRPDRRRKEARSVSDFVRLLALQRRDGDGSGRRERSGGDRSRDQDRPDHALYRPGRLALVCRLGREGLHAKINDQGGINGRKINLISVDDGYLPWRTGNETRKLIEVDHVAFTFGSIGTPTQLAVAKYLNERKIPQLFIESGAYRWGNYKETPYTMGGMRPSYRLGARLYTRYI